MKTDEKKERKKERNKKIKENNVTRDVERNDVVYEMNDKQTEIKVKKKINKKRN